MTRNKKSISFMMPGSCGAPGGGPKVIFEQANRLAKDGWEVHIVYPVYNFIRRPTIRNILGVIKRYFIGFFNHKYRGDKWFPLEKSIYHDVVWRLKKMYMPETNFYCATSLETSYYLNKYEIPASKKLYYIQGFETWALPEQYAYDSYKFDMIKITIANYLAKKVESTGNKSYLIPNGFDFEALGLDTPIENRNPHTAIMMYSSNNDIKRWSDSFAAFKIVKQIIPDLKVYVFGVPDRPSDLPDWFEYYQTPKRNKLRELYNNAAVFVAASRTEGMALPPAEAYICGCSVCCTNIDGFSMYAFDGKTALLSPVFDINALADNILKMMTNNELRIQLAKDGNKYIQQFTWEKAYEKFQTILLESI